MVLGEKIVINSKLKRVYQNNHMTWIDDPLINSKQVVIVGTRTLYTGRIRSDGESTWFERDGYVKSILVADNLRRKPFYIRYDNY